MHNIHIILKFLSYLNFHKVPFPTRLISGLTAVNEFARSVNPFDVHTTFSCYSLSFKFFRYNTTSGGEKEI